MTNYYDVPGVYIEEQAGPGVIAGVSTSTAAFIGPACRGLLNVPKRISSYDDFLRDYAIQRSNGQYDPYISNAFYLASAVEGFFNNGGRQAYIVRVGSGKAAIWQVKNQNNEEVFRLRAKAEGIAGNSLDINLKVDNATGSDGVEVFNDSATVTSVSGLMVFFNSSPPFKPGDVVTKDGSEEATVVSIQGSSIQLNRVIGISTNDKLRIADLKPERITFRLRETKGLFPGSVVHISGEDLKGKSREDYAVLESVDPAGFVTLRANPTRTITFSLQLGKIVKLTSQDFLIIVTHPNSAPEEQFANLSLDPSHPHYVFTSLNSDWIEVIPPLQPPLTVNYPARLVNIPASSLTPIINGINDDPSSLTSQDYQTGLDALKNIDGVSIISIPDAAAHPESITIQKAMINHCLLMKDRFAILDSWRNVPSTGPGSVEEQRLQVTSTGGFAALYYPWVKVRDPFSRGPQAATMFIPPSGHIAGIYARLDNERGVHKAPANTDVRGVVGLENLITDGQQGPLNLEGINVLRIFPGLGQVTVWGARTTVDPSNTDWQYVNIRRLFLYLEESIEEGIRWAVFEPNNLQLWQKLKRTITEFLTRVWRDGALFGETPDKAFYVRIDEALNPDSTRALGRLYIEIGVRPSYPAEFIIVRIGIWQGGSELIER